MNDPFTNDPVSDGSPKPLDAVLRICTYVHTSRIYTLFAFGKWTTILTQPKTRTEFIDADDLLTAGTNHLDACKKAKEYHGDKGEAGR